MEPPWVGGTKVCSRGLGHMTKMDATPIYGKNPLKIFFSGTLTFFMARSNLLPYAFYMGKYTFLKKLTTNDRRDKMLLLTSKFCPQDIVCRCPGLHTCKTNEKICIKSEFKEISLNLQQMCKVIRSFCWHQNFVPKGLSAPALALYTCIKSWKNVYKVKR